MDLTPIILGIVAVNVGTLLAGTVLAIRRSRRERHVDVAVPRDRSAGHSTDRQTSVWANRSD